MADIALGLGLGLGLGIPCCCYVVGLTLLFCRKNEPNQAEEPPASKSQPVSTATPMEDFSGSIDDVQTQIASIIPLNHLATKSSDLNLLSDDTKRNRKILNGEFQRAEPLSNSLLEEATIATQDVSIVLPIEMQIPITLHTTN
jgi:hypothetical protein